LVSPAIVRGNNATVFFSGMPSDAAGPLADTVTPIFHVRECRRHGRREQTRCDELNAAVTQRKANCISPPLVSRLFRARAGRQRMPV